MIIVNRTGGGGGAKKGGSHHKRKKKSAPRGHSSSSSGSTRTLTGSAIVAALENDTTALSRLTGDLASDLLSGGFTAEIVKAIIAVVNQAQTKQAGQLIAGTVSTNTGALQLNGSGAPIEAMVFLNGAATAVACYVPTHIRSQIATGQEVWVLPVNGDMSDLMIFSLRAIF